MNAFPNISGLAASLVLAGVAAAQFSGPASLTTASGGDAAAGHGVPGANAWQDPVRPYKLSPEELAVWNDPAFRQWFAQSYAAETDIEPRVTAEERDRMLKILDLISANEMDKAAKLIEKYKGEAASAVFDFTLANIEFQEDRLDDAAANYLVAVGKYPKFRRAWRNLGLIYVKQNEFERAVPAFTRVLELGGGDAVTYGLLGFAYANVERSLSAESAFRMAVMLDPDTVDWKMGLARSLFRQQRYADAVALCDRLIADKPDSADLWLLQANAYLGLKQPMRAAENYELVDHLGKSTFESLTMLGDICVNQELYDMAVDAYDRAMELKPDGKPDRAIRAAKVLTARSAYEPARLLLERIDAVYGDRITDAARKDLLKLRARMAVAAGAGDEQVAVLEQIVELDPLDGEALILLGQYSARTDDSDKAIFYFERAAAIEGFEAEANVQQARLLVHQGKYDEALPLLRHAQQIDPHDNVQKYMEQVQQLARTR